MKNIIAAAILAGAIVFAGLQFGHNTPTQVKQEKAQEKAQERVYVSAESSLSLGTNPDGSCALTGSRVDPFLRYGAGTVLKRATCTSSIETEEYLAITFDVPVLFVEMDSSDVGVIVVREDLTRPIP